MDAVQMRGLAKDRDMGASIGTAMLVIWTVRPVRLYLLSTGMFPTPLFNPCPFVSVHSDQSEIYDFQPLLGFSSE
jgi:hypothetical protein